MLCFPWKGLARRLTRRTASAAFSTQAPVNDSVLVYESGTPMLARVGGALFALKAVVAGSAGCLFASREVRKVQDMIEASASSGMEWKAFLAQTTLPYPVRPLCLACGRRVCCVFACELESTAVCSFCVCVPAMCVCVSVVVCCGLPASCQDLRLSALLLVLAGCSQWLSYRVLHTVTVKIVRTPDDILHVTHLTLLGSKTRQYPRAGERITQLLVTCTDTDTARMYAHLHTHSRSLWLRVPLRPHDSLYCNGGKWLGEKVLLAAKARLEVGG